MRALCQGRHWDGPRVSSYNGEQCLVGMSEVAYVACDGGEANANSGVFLQDWMQIFGKVWKKKSGERNM